MDKREFEATLRILAWRTALTMAEEEGASDVIARADQIQARLIEVGLGAGGADGADGSAGSGQSGQSGTYTSPSEV